MQKSSRVATIAETNVLARRITSKSKDFGKSKADRMARDAEARLRRWSRGKV